MNKKIIDHPINNNAFFLLETLINYDLIKYGSVSLGRSFIGYIRCAATEVYGKMAKIVLDQWKLKTTKDISEILEIIIEVEDIKTTTEDIDILNNWKILNQPIWEIK